ncbi:hypothetical protein ABW21_db0208343 [Orbilia brochopaga]|nr:hypothetical protein ABW21_db0208343 [Drechslerella brochopaga]
MVFSSRDIALTRIEEDIYEPQEPPPPTETTLELPERPEMLTLSARDAKLRAWEEGSRLDAVDTFQDTVAVDIGSENIETEITTSIYRSISNVVIYGILETPDTRLLNLQATLYRKTR